MCMKNYLTIDIGRNWLRYALISEEIDVCKTGKEQLNSFTSREDLFTTIKKITDSFCLRTDSLAITMPGIIDTDSAWRIPQVFIALSVMNRWQGKSVNILV